MTDPWDILTKSVEPSLFGHAPPPPADQAPWDGAANLSGSVPNGEYTFSFGKYKGRPISDVPASYVTWCLENTDRCNPGHTKFELTTWELFRKRLGLPIDELEAIRLIAKSRVEAAKVEKAVASKVTAQGLTDGLRRAIRGWYSTMARRYHPDHGGSEVQQVVVNACYQELVKTLDAWEKKT